MSERYFHGFNFTQFEAKPFEIVTVPYKRAIVPSAPKETVYLEDLIGGLRDIIVEPEPEVWSPDQIQQEFSRKLIDIDRQIKYPRLTMRKRTMKFVTPDEMRPQTDEQRQWLIQRYGEYIIDGKDGDCVRNSDGTWTLRIGFASQEESKSKDVVLQIMGHEYGHTLGKHLGDPIFEELKAYTFANLFMRYFYAVDEYRIYKMDVSTVHDTAQFWLEQLLDKGTSEEAVLAHLTGKKFGTFYPNDYLK